MGNGFDLHDNYPMFSNLFSDANYINVELQHETNGRPKPSSKYFRKSFGTKKDLAL